MATLLVVDDDDVLRGVMRKVLGRAGYSVVEAEDGLMALPKPLSAEAFLSTIERVISPAERRPPARSSERRSWP